MSDIIETPGQKGFAPAPAKKERPGFMVLVPGECLRPASRMWNDAQRASGVWIKLVYLTASEEEQALTEAVRTGNAAATGLYQVKRSLAAVADNLSDENGGDTPGELRGVPHLERDGLWEELGQKGRALVLAAYNQGVSPSEEAVQRSAQSFRICA